MPSSATPSLLLSRLWLRWALALIAPLGARSTRCSRTASSLIASSWPTPASRRLTSCLHATTASSSLRSITWTSSKRSKSAALRPKWSSAFSQTTRTRSCALAPSLALPSPPGPRSSPLAAICRSSSLASPSTSAAAA
eukprot:Mycagemm_TRINITY_DN8211_c0_g1::TRINITY_DN8211_c0_g1_i1::g.1927::m.1927 type:complete len:138 gc:universal TRINITY_DN8211_c0_g1_i1:389-802(+)